MSYQLFPTIQMLFLTGPQPRSSNRQHNLDHNNKGGPLPPPAQPHVGFSQKVILSMVKPNLVTPKFVTDAGDLDVPL